MKAELTLETSGQPPDSAVASAARVRMESGRCDPLFIADWHRALFLHYAVDARELQAVVPFELDLWHGEQAFISLVAFTMRGMSPGFGGRLGGWLTAPMASHAFLNARTYVRHGDERGIFFIREWLPNLVARCLGPMTYGLPYRLGEIDYRHRHESGRLCGEVRPRRGRGRLAYRATPRGAVESDAERRDFLLERYTAFTSYHGLRRKFHVWHGPWRAAPMAVVIDDDSIVSLVPGCRGGLLACAHYSPGVGGVWMGRPRLAGP